MYKKIIITICIILMTSICFANNDVSKFLQKSKKQAVENEIRVSTFTNPELFIKINLKQFLNLE